MPNEKEPIAQTVAASAITPQDMPKPTAPVEIPAAPIDQKPALPAAPSNPELDESGCPFDPARHIRKKHPTTGRWMPKGGRKKRDKAATSPASPSPLTSPEKSASPASMPTPPPSASFIPKEEPARPVATEPAPDARAEVVDHADDAAEVVTRGAQFGAGLVFDDPDAGKISEAEHRNMTKATAAYIRTKGWQASAGVALALVFVAWLLRIVSKPGPQAKVKSWLSIGRETAAAPSPSISENPTKETANSFNRAPDSVPPLAK